jgi:two-component system, LytTR family, response regulator LytT
MQQSYKVLILEDDVLIAESISSMLQGNGFDIVGPVNDYETAASIVAQEEFDIALLDINLGTAKTGLDFAKEYIIPMAKPFIFLSAYSDVNTIKEAVSLMPATYIVKPASSATLFAAIQVALLHHSKNEEIITETEPNFFFLKVGKNDVKINWDDIKKVEHEKNYVRLISSKFNNSGYLLRTSLNNFINNIIPKKYKASFIQINRKVLLRIDVIDKINKDNVQYNSELIEIGETYWPEIKKRFEL